MIQDSTDKQDEVLIKVPVMKGQENAVVARQSTRTRTQTEAEIRRRSTPDATTVKKALDTFGKEAEGTTALSDDDPTPLIKLSEPIRSVRSPESSFAIKRLSATLLGLVGNSAFHRLSLRLDVCGGRGYRRISRRFDDARVLSRFFNGKSV